MYDYVCIRRARKLAIALVFINFVRCIFRGLQEQHKMLNHQPVPPKKIKMNTLAQLLDLAKEEGLMVSAKYQGRK